MTLPTTMRASVLTAAQKITLEERRRPEPAADEVLVEVTAVGVCGSDAHFWHDGVLGEWVVREPLVLGHESAGRIVAVGSAVSPARIGERVSIEPQRPSPTSPETLNGRYNLDPGMRFYATPGVDGAFAQYVTIQSHFAWPVPDTVSDDAAALMEPLSVAIAAARKAELAAGSRVLVTGAGPIGIVMTQVAVAHGVAEVIVADIDAERRTTALSFGADRVLDPAADELGSLGLGVDAFIDASGAPSAVHAGIREVRPAGRVVLVGMGPTDVVVPMSAIQNRELVLTGVFRYANTWPTAIDLVARKKVDLDALVTGHFGLAEVEAALASTTRRGTLKSVVNPQA